MRTVREFRYCSWPHHMPTGLHRGRKAHSEYLGWLLVITKKSFTEYLFSRCNTQLPPHLQIYSVCTCALSVIIVNPGFLRRSWLHNPTAAEHRVRESRSRHVDDKRRNRRQTIYTAINHRGPHPRSVHQQIRGKLRISIYNSIIRTTASSTAVV